MVSVATPLIQIFNCRRSLTETSNTLRLNHSALTFTPLTFIPGLHTNQSIAPGAKPFELHLAVSISRCGLVPLFKRSHSGPAHIFFENIAARR